jgi:predicted CoA-binding protein
LPQKLLPASLRIVPLSAVLSTSDCRTLVPQPGLTGDPMNEPDVIRNMLRSPATLAVIGLSDNPVKPSNYVSEYMQRVGFRIFPINPSLEKPVLNERPYPNLAALPEKPDVVNVFRLPRFIPAIVDQMISLGLTQLWVQQGIVDMDSAARAEAAGIRVVMDRCILVEHRRLSL